MSSRFLKAYAALVGLTLGLIAMGGSVRAMKAGLACPDWPLCFGDVIPDYHPEVYFEFIHRAWAGVLGILIIIFHIKILRTPAIPKHVKILCNLVFVVLGLQVVMGAQTVLLFLKAHVVVTHLVLGSTLLLSQLWIYFYLSFLKKAIEKKKKKEPLESHSIPSTYRRYTLALFVAFALQLILGGQVAANYAGNVCPEFPLCHGQWVPTLEGQIGIQVMHRLWAYAVILFSFSFYFSTRQFSDQHPIKTSAGLLINVVLLQVLVGISNVLFGTPAIITVLHLTLAEIILGVGLWQIFVCWVICDKSVEPLASELAAPQSIS